MNFVGEKGTALFDHAVIQFFQVFLAISGVSVNRVGQ